MELFIVSGDSLDFAKPVRIIKYQQANVLRRSCLIVELESTTDYTEFGIYSPVSKYILLDRFDDNRLKELKEFPIEVHMFIPKDNLKPLEGFNKWDELFNAAWASIYESL